MIEIIVNGDRLTLPDGSGPADVVAALTGREIGPDGQPADGEPLGIAVAVDDAVVPRRAWESHRIAGGARVEVLTAAQGG
ncbi:sulfur carrier protein ThiS [Microbacterium karelineae]|uniref:sulfur carrier protein ThiS n=1 Tax=Microbacterium karelineae TaxID=2654283 RepID=UPI0012EA2A21|nr:sulfur carrier protein ThiS [Microbacterium karelineae]